MTRKWYALILFPSSFCLLINAAAMAFGTHTITRVETILVLVALGLVGLIEGLESLRK